MSTTTFSSSASNQQRTSSPEPNDPIPVLLSYLSSPCTTTSSSTTTILDNLHASLLSSLQRSGWTEQVRGLALELLRAGHCDCFEEIVDTIVALATGSEDVTASSLAVARGKKRKRKTQMMMRVKLKKAKITEGVGGGSGATMENGGVENSDRDGDGQSEDGTDVDVDDDGASGNIDEDYDGNGNMVDFPDIRIPQGIVAEGVKMLHDALEGVFVVDGGGTEHSPSDTTTTGEHEGDKIQKENQKNKLASTNGVVNTNGSTAPTKKPPVSSSSKTATTSTDGRSTKLKSATKGKLQEIGEGKLEKKTKKG
ncbi:hypothetical protein ACJ72_02519 [Emergomyces africanus]|uniref:Uncharacterized protein n=1 Tax=Emergomyces africanus TaxID=1955775 RepID=A0A1B7P280_9EURO|nr:hypothetical protein ACJ72_02519 [Emergomyces africanus]